MERLTVQETLTKAGVKNMTQKRKTSRPRTTIVYFHYEWKSNRTPSVSLKKLSTPSKRSSIMIKKMES